MQGRQNPTPRGRHAELFGVAAILATVWGTAPAWSQTSPAPSASKATPAIAATDSAAPGPMIDSGILQTGCGTCGNGLLGRPSYGAGCTSGCSSGRCDSGCYPGRQACDGCCHADTFFGRVCGGLYECLCCPDPCYDPPHWLAVADAAFFVDAARPITQQRIRIDSAWDFHRPDRAEYFWARQVNGKGPNFLVNSVDFEEVSLYTEAATGRVGVFIQVPYREVEGDKVGDAQFTQSGFADLIVGTKSLLIDCELLQLSFGFTTYIPTATAGKGLGTGHVSLEPALFLAVRVTPFTYLQYESAFWIPIGGDPTYQGEVWRNQWSLNQILWQPAQNFQLIGTAEFNLWSVMGGFFTDETGASRGSHVSIFSAGPGIRAVLCDKFDIGVGSAFSLTGNHWAEETVRVEFRWRF